MRPDAHILCEFNVVLLQTYVRNLILDHAIQCNFVIDKLLTISHINECVWIGFELISQALSAIQTALIADLEPRIFTGVQWHI